MIKKPVSVCVSLVNICYVIYVYYIYSTAYFCCQTPTIMTGILTL